MTADNTVGIQRGRPFEPGQSGNPSGKPKGTRHRSTLAMEALLEGESEALARKAVEMALAGDGAAMRLCMERLLPARKDRPVIFALPNITNAADASSIMAALLTAVGNGEITPNEGSEVSKVMETYIKTLEANEYDRRLRTLEERTKQ